MYKVNLHIGVVLYKDKSGSPKQSRMDDCVQHLRGTLSHGAPLSFVFLIVQSRDCIRTARQIPQSISPDSRVCPPILTYPSSIMCRGDSIWVMTPVPAKQNHGILSRQGHISPSRSICHLLLRSSKAAVLRGPHLLRNCSRCAFISA